MKKLLFLMLYTCSGVYAESITLPPVIEHSTYLNNSSQISNTAVKVTSTNALYEMQGRLEQLQLELRQLRGTVEVQSQTISQLKKRQATVYTDLDQRLQELAKGKVVNLANSSEMPINNTFIQPVKEISPSIVRDQKLLYQEAYETLRNGHNSRAITAFKVLLIEFPKGEYADNSQYWLAEAYKVNQDVDAAKQAFTKVTTDYPNSPKVPDALLKLSYIALEQNDITLAKDYLTQITTIYSGTTAAHLARKKLLQIKGIMQP